MATRPTGTTAAERKRSEKSVRESERERAGSAENKNNNDERGLWQKERGRGGAPRDTRDEKLNGGLDRVTISAYDRA